MIKQFQEEYRWLSNMEPCNIEMDGEIYPSVEHAYMSAKSVDPLWKDFCISTTSPYTVKEQSKFIALRPDWEYIKKSVMLYCLEQKYRQEPYMSKLIATGDEHIQEGNNWKDIFWGIDLATGKGQNNLGIMIMNIRTELQNLTQI